MSVTARQDLAASVARLVRDVPDYPVPGVVFKDITPLLADGEVFGAVVAHQAERAGDAVDLVAGMEARGFILGGAVAAALGVGFVPVRKAGKLPFTTMATEYQLEYGAATIEVHPDTIPPGSRILMVDDVLATGGTAAATARLLTSAGGVVVGMSFLMELTFLHGRDLLPDVPVDVIWTT